MPSAQVGIGQWGSQLRLTLTQKSQSQGNNTSSVECIVEVYNGGTTRSWNSAGANWSLSGGITKGSANGPIDVPSKAWRTVGTHTANVTHNSDGTKSITVKATLGDTGTTALGRVTTSVSTTISLTRIPKPPSAPGTPSVSSISSGGARFAWSAPSNNGGASVTGYVFQIAKNTAFTDSPSSVNTSGAAYTVVTSQADTQFYVRVAAKNSAGTGGWSGARGFKTAPNAPNPVSAVTITRVSDSAQDSKWKNNPASGRPYQYIEIERRDTVNGTRVRIARLGGTVTSYRDSTTVAGRRYDYYIRPTNAGGGAGWVAAPSGVNTTPVAPSGVSAVKDGTGIVVSWTPAKIVQWGIVQYIIEDNPGGAGWTQVGSPGNVSSWTHTSPNASVTHQYRVKTVVYLYGASDTPRLTSGASSASGVVQLLAPPLMPTLLGPTGALDRDSDIVFSWKHNPVDTTKQTEFELRYRVNGGAWVNLAGTGSSQSATVAALGVTASVEWQVRTRGQFPTFGPWSALASFRTVASPTVAIDSPSPGSLPISTVYAAWGYYQVDGVAQTRAVAVLTDALTGDVLETRTTASSNLIFFTHVLANETAYTLTVTVTSADGLTATDTVAFTTDFPLPVTVEAIPVFDRETGATTLTFTEPPEPALYAWDGTPDASPSTKTSEGKTVTNLATNPRNESTSGTVEVARNRARQPQATGWAAVYGTGGVGVTDRPRIGVHGAPVTRMTWTTKPSTAMATRMACFTGDAGTGGASVFPGETVILSVDVTTSGAPANISWDFYNGLNYVTAGNSPSITVSSDPSAPTRIEQTVVIPAGVNRLVVFVRIIAQDVGVGTVLTGSRLAVGVPFYADGDYSPNPDLTPAWTGSVNNSLAILTGKIVAGTGVGWQSAQWAASGNFSHYIPDGSVQDYVIAAGESFQIQPRADGQTYIVNGDPYVSTDEPIHISGPAMIETGQGWWDNLMTTDGVYDGPYFDGSTPSTVPAESLAVQRAIGDGAWVTLAQGLALDDAMTDPLPSLTGVNTYTVISRTDLPTEAAGKPVDHVIGEKQWMYFNHGAGFGEVERLLGNPEVSQSTGRNSAVHAMAGVSFPTSVRGSLLTAAYAVSGTITPDSAQRIDWENLGFTDTTVCYRDPAGRRVFGNIGELGFGGTTLQSVELSLDRTHFIEGLVTDDTEPES